MFEFPSLSMEILWKARLEDVLTFYFTFYFISFYWYFREIRDSEIRRYNEKKHFLGY